MNATIRFLSLSAALAGALLGGWLGGAIGAPALGAIGILVSAAALAASPFRSRRRA